jgi:hypothetical protein
VTKGCSAPPPLCCGPTERVGYLTVAQQETQLKDRLTASARSCLSHKLNRRTVSCQTHHLARGFTLNHGSFCCDSKGKKWPRPFGTSGSHLSHPCPAAPLRFFPSLLAPSGPCRLDVPRNPDHRTQPAAASLEQAIDAAIPRNWSLPLPGADFHPPPSRSYATVENNTDLDVKPYPSLPRHVASVASSPRSRLFPFDPRASYPPIGTTTLYFPHTS